MRGFSGASWGKEVGVGDSGIPTLPPQTRQLQSNGIAGLATVVCTLRVGQEPVHAGLGAPDTPPLVGRRGPGSSTSTPRLRLGCLTPGESQKICPRKLQEGRVSIGLGLGRGVSGTPHPGMNWKGGEVPPPPPGRPAYAQPLSPRRQVPVSMAFVTDSNRPQPLWQPPPTACLTAAGAASEVPSLLMHPSPTPPPPSYKRSLMLWPISVH